MLETHLWVILTKPISDNKFNLATVFENVENPYLSDHGETHLRQPLQLATVFENIGNSSPSDLSEIHLLRPLQLGHDSMTIDLQADL